MPRVWIVRTAEYTWYWHAIQPFFAISLSFFLSFSPFVFLTETTGAQRGRESAETDQKDIACRPLVLSPLGSCHFFSLFAFQLTLLLFPAVFLCACVIVAENYLSPDVGRDRIVFFLSLSRQVYSCRKKIVRERSFFFSSFLYILYYALEDTPYSLERRACYWSERCVSRIHYAASHRPFPPPTPSNLIKPAVTHLARVSRLNFSFALPEFFYPTFPDFDLSPIARRTHAR